MGRKISVDSATLMNKGLELIEACLLFGMDPGGSRWSSIRRASCIRWSSTSTARCWRSWATRTCAPRSPMRSAGRSGSSSGVQSLDFVAAARLDFEAPDLGALPGAGLARAAAEAGGTAPAVLNAANEVAVAAFLERPTGFLGIPAAHRSRCSSGTRSGRRTASRTCSPRIAGRVTLAESTLASRRPGQGHDHTDATCWPSSSRSACWSPCTSTAISGWPGAWVFKRAALLDRLRQAAVDRAAARTAPSTSSRRSRSAATSSCSTSAKGRSARRELPQAFNRRPVWQRIAGAAGRARRQLPVRRRSPSGCCSWPACRRSSPCSATSPPVHAAAQAGLQAGDEILAVGRREHGTRESAVLACSTR